MKTDAGPGRLSKEASSLDFREYMHNVGYVILLGLPNGTAATQEMDVCYGDLKRESDKSTIRVASRKMAERVKARAKSHEKPTINLLVQLLEEEDDDDSDDEDMFTLHHGKSACNVTIGNPDLPNIVNGFPGDPIEKRPFDFTFMKEKILSWWKKVGFLPMSRNDLNHNKVRWEMGAGGAPKEATIRLELLVKDYEECARMLNARGFNGGVLDLEPPRVEKTASIPDDEEAQIQLILKNKVMNKAGSLFKVGVHVANSRVLIEAARRHREGCTKAKAAKVLKDKCEKNNEALKAIELYRKWVADGKKIDGKGYPELTKPNSKAILNVLLTRIDKDGKRSSYSSMTECRKWLGELKGEKTWVNEMEQVEKEYTGFMDDGEEAPM